MAVSNSIPLPKNPFFIDLTGKYFGRLFVVSYAGPSRHGSLWNCICSCGLKKQVYGGSLRTRRTKSCGCLPLSIQQNRKLVRGQKKETPARRSAYRPGPYEEVKKPSNNPAYKVYLGARQRCFRGDRNYGSRGIKFLYKSFSEFIDDVGERPAPGYSIDRIDNDGHYEPGNCRWATPKQQTRNRRMTKRLTINGETRPLAEWCEILGVDRHLVRGRLKIGWCQECSFKYGKREGKCSHRL